jgi:dolichyl-phosphate-mannose--protein O-mannosyl transferase
MGIQQFHDSMSFPSQWPILRGIMTYFWGRDGLEIRCLGNVFSYYFALAGVVLVVFGFRCPQFWSGLQFVIGWAVCYFPFFLVPRVMYQYHYCIPLIIGSMAFGASLDLFIPKKWKQAVAIVVTFLTLFGFWLWSPFVYGTKHHDRNAEIWTKIWIDGDDAHKMRRSSHYAKQNQ